MEKAADDAPGETLDGTLTVERYAEVLAHTVYFGMARRSEVLERLGVEEPAWAAADAKWTQALVDEALQDEHPVTVAFAASFAPVHGRLKAEKPVIGSIGAPLAVAPAPAPARPEDPPSQPVPVEATPTYLRVDARKVPETSAAVALPAAGPPPPLTLQRYASLCAEVAVFPDRAEAIFHAYGFGEVHDRRAADLSWQERLRRNPAEYQGWRALYQRWIGHFERTKAGGGLPSPAQEGEREAPVPEPGAGLDAPPPEPPRVEPSQVPGYLQPHSSATPAPLPHVSPATRAAENLAGTAMAFELPTALRPKASAALPFQTGASSPIATAPPEPRHPPAPTSGETIGEGVDLMAQMRGTLPFARASAAATPVAYPRMPLQTYASFCAELAAFPDAAAAIFTKYNVSGEPARAALVQEWQTRFDAHADTKADWQKHFDTFRAYLLRQPR